MISIKFEEREKIGLQYALETLHGCSPFGQERVRRLRFYAPEERAELEEELYNVEQAANAAGELKDDYNRLMTGLCQMKDIRNSLRRCAEGETPDHVELFEIKGYLQRLEGIRPLFERITAVTRFKGMAFHDVTAALAILDPDGTGSRGFYIPDSATPKLKEIRNAKKTVEERLFHAQTDAEKDDLRLQRTRLCGEEDAEEMHVRKRMGAALAPMVPDLLSDAETAGRLDFIIQKALFAVRYGGVRPALNLSSSILVSDSPNSDGNYTVIYNSAPSAPPSITAPATCYSGQNINISCAAATDPDGDALTYCFERSYNSGAWTQVQASASRTFTEAVSTAWNTLKYRVRAKDSYGNYSAYTTSGDIAVIHNQPPVISGSNADLGTKRGDFTYQYSVTDPDGDTVNVVEKIDGKTIATKNAITLGATQTLSVSGNTFTALTNAQHTITITATDSAGNSAVRTLTFTKSIAGFVITLSTPLEANSQPTRANIKVTRDIPAGGTFKVEATNNPFDASPVWEDCTNAVVQGVAHVFTNKINTAAQYGMNIRVTVQRGDALTACWVSGIGGNFE